MTLKIQREKKSMELKCTKHELKVFFSSLNLEQFVHRMPQSASNFTCLAKKWF